MERLWRLEGTFMSNNNKTRPAPESFEDLIAMAAAKAKGKRPQYGTDPMTDHLVAMIATLATELSVTRERADTLERLLASKGVISRDEIEAYEPDLGAGRERQQENLAFATRLLRSMIQEAESLHRPEKSAEEMVEELKS